MTRPTSVFLCRGLYLGLWLLTTRKSSRNFSPGRKQMKQAETIFSEEMNPRRPTCLGCKSRLYGLSLLPRIRLEVSYDWHFKTVLRRGGGVGSLALRPPFQRSPLTPVAVFRRQEARRSLERNPPLQPSMRSLLLPV